MTHALEPAPGNLDRCARCVRPLRWRPDQPRHLADSGERVLLAVRRWPDGPICSGCFAKALETYGCCDRCGVDRLLPGVSPDGQCWCTDCAGGLGNFTCTRCGREGWMEQRGLCGRCVLTDRVTELLDDGTGRVRPELEPLADLITSMARPRSGILWLSRPAPQRVLRAIARGQVRLTHADIDTLTPRKSSIYVRDLLVTAGILPPVDRFLFLFEQWWPNWLDTVANPEHRKALRRFITWHILRSLRTAAAEGDIGYARADAARRQLRASAWFLHHLAATGTSLSRCGQADLDRVFADGNHSREHNLRPFLRWAIRTHRMPALTLPPYADKAVTLITQQQRVELIRRIYHDRHMELTDRVLGLLVLLYAQPLSRIAQLTVSNISIDTSGQLLIRLGEPATPVPAPFDAIIREHLAARTNQTTATNPGSHWLFPGRRAGQPLHATSMRLRLHNLGIPNLSSRNRAIRELLRQAPPVIIAGMLNYSTAGAENIAIEYGATWKHYAAAPRSPRRPPRIGQ